MKKILLLLSLTVVVFAANCQLSVELGAKRTDLKNSALTFGITYLKSLDSLFGGQELFIPGKHSFFMVTPELDINTGTSDAFSSIVVKASGLWNVFKTKTVAGLEAPDYNKTFHSLPLSLGIESNNKFNNVNGILEAGWVPYYQSYARNSPTFVKRSRFGLFFQTGYKFSVDSSGIGGQEYSAEEKPKRIIARGRGLFSLDTDAFLKVGGLNVGLVGSAEGWADIVNSEFYYKLEGRARVYLTPTQWFDFIIQKGSGAPLFNGAEQIGIGTTIKF